MTPRDPASDGVAAPPHGALALDNPLLHRTAGAADGKLPARAYALFAAWLAGLSRRCALRTQLLLILMGLLLTAWVIGGAITVLHARKATRIEITAAMNLAEMLIREAVPMIEHGAKPEQALASLPADVGSVRPVRISVTNAAGSPLAPAAPQSGIRPKPDTVRPPAPGWFAALIAPSVQTREVPAVVAGQRIGAVLLTSAPGDEIAEVWDDTMALARLTLIFGVVATIVLYLLFARVLAPLERVAAGLLDLERRDYQVRLRRPNVRELDVIANRFNTLAAALDSIRAENSSLSKRLITAQDNERRQTALDLHDEVGPWLFALRVNATSIAKLGDPAVAQGRAREMLGMIERLQRINRGVLNRLRPMALGQIPLADLLSGLVQERAREHPDIALSFLAEGVASSYGESIDLTVYRCVQESLTNIVRHAGARRARLELVHERPAPGGGEDRLLLAVSDDGCGIKPGTPKGRGLQGMQERVQALDGAYRLADAPGGGTSLRIAIPLPHALESAPRASAS
ncbi:MAG: histidine kinase [Pseudolabrys sp.]